MSTETTRSITTSNLWLKLKQELKCPVCLEIFESPHSTPCSHIFCYNCIMASLRIKNECPICKLPMSKRGLQKSLIISNIVEIFSKMISQFQVPTLIEKPIDGDDLKLVKEEPGSKTENISKYHQEEEYFSQSNSKKRKKISNDKSDADEYSTINRPNILKRIEETKLVKKRYKEREKKKKGDQKESKLKVKTNNQVDPESGEETKFEEEPILIPCSDSGSSAWDDKIDTLYCDKSNSNNIEERGQPVCFLTSGVSDFHEKAISDFLKKFKLLSRVDSFSSSITHLVVGGPNRTIKYYLGLASGCWVVSIDWVIQSLSSGRILDEDKFLHPDASIPSEIQVHPFTQTSFIMVGQIPRVSNQDIMQLLTLGGSKESFVLSEITKNTRGTQFQKRLDSFIFQKPSDRSNSRLSVVLLTIDEETQSYLSSLLSDEKYRFLVPTPRQSSLKTSNQLVHFVTFQWVLDSIRESCPQPYFSYFPSFLLVLGR